MNGARVCYSHEKFSYARGARRRNLHVPAASVAVGGAVLATRGVRVGGGLHVFTEHGGFLAKKRAVAPLRGTGRHDTTHCSN